MAVTADTSKSCLNCGDRVGAEAPLGLCPKCLLAQYLTPTEGLAPAPSDAAGRSAVAGSRSETGSTFGDYDLLEEIGRGGMGVVYRARQRGLDRVVALKMIIPSRLTSATDLQRFRLEAETAARLEHPHILPVYEVGEISGQPYFTTKYLEGGNLTQKITGMWARPERKTTDDTTRHGRRPSRRSKAFPLTRPSACAPGATADQSDTLSPSDGERAGVRGSFMGSADDTDGQVRLFLKVCQAVAYAHARGVLHRDLKPANIILDRGGEPYVADFGLARLLEQESDLTLSHAMVGTPAYAAPEQLRDGSRHLTTAADVYSLGTVLYEMLAGRPPLRGPTTAETVRQVLDDDAKPLRALNPAVDRDLEAICRKCLEKDPRQRYANAGELARELEHYLAGEPIQARPLDTVALAWRWCRRRPAVAGLIGAIVAAVLVVAVVSTVAAVRIAASRRMEERENYYSLIGLAQSLVEQGEIDQAKEALLKCPPRFRHWEWGYLMFRCHQDVLSIPVHTDIKFDSKLRQASSRDQPQKIMFNHNGSRLASLGRDRSVRVWDATDGHRLFALGGTNRPVTAVAFNPSSPQLAVAFSDGAAGVWDTGAWQKQWEFRFATGNVEGLVYPSDGKRLALRGPNELAICDATTGAVVGRHRSEAPVTAVSLVSGGNQLLVRTEREAFLLDTGQASGTAVLPDPDLRSGGSEERRHLPQVQSAALSRDAATTEFAPAANARSAAKPLPLPPISDGSLFISPTADRFVTISSKGVVSLWTNTTTSVELGQIRGPQPGWVRQVFFSDDGRRFCTGGESSTARVWNTDNGKEILTIPYKVYRAAFSPDGKRLVTAGTDRIAQVWDVDGRRECLQLRGHSSAIDFIAVSPDGSRLATLALDGTAKLWSARPGREVLQEDGWVWGLSVSPDARRIVTAPGEEFKVWDAESGQRLVTVDTRVHSVIASVFSVDGRRLVTVGAEGLGKAWDVETGRFLFNLEGHTRNLRSVAYAPSGKWIATTGQDGTARIWEAGTGRQIHCLEHGSNLVNHVAFSPDSHRLATASNLGLRMWDVVSGRLLFQVGSGSSVLWQALFSPDGRHLALLYTMEPVVRVCDAQTGKVVATWPTGITGAGAFSGDGKRFLVTVSGYDFVMGMSEASAQLWDFESGRRVLTLKGHSDLFHEVAFAAEDRRIVSSSFDMTVRQWETFPWREVEYPGSAREPFLDRARRFADQYWRTRLAAEAQPVNLIRSRPDSKVLWPRRDARATSAQLDLTEHYTYVLQAASMPVFTQDEQDNYLRELGSGLLEMGGVPFDVRGVIQLRRRTDLDGPWQLAWERIAPINVEDIRVQQKVRRLHILHGTACTERSVKGGDEIARFIWHYETGQEASPIFYGQDVQDWWWHPENGGEPTSARSRVVWTGSNPIAREKGYKLRLYLTTIENPRPQELVRSLDYVSAMSESAPFLIALTVE